jgi:hypothetical protein
VVESRLPMPLVAGSIPSPAPSLSPDYSFSSNFWKVEAPNTRCTLPAQLQRLLGVAGDATRMDRTNSIFTRSQVANAAASKFGYQSPHERSL